MEHLFKKTYALIALSFVLSAFIELIVKKPLFTIIGYGEIIILSLVLYASLKTLLPQERYETEEHLPLILTIIIAIMPYIALKFSGAILGIIVFVTLIGGIFFYLISLYLFTGKKDL